MSISDFETSPMEDLIFLARQAETAERYEDMCCFMKQFVKKKNADLSVEERNLLSVGYKNVVAARRNAWRCVGGEDQHPEALKKYKDVILRELETYCIEVITLIQQVLAPATQGKKNEEEVFYLKMMGDYYRYLAEAYPDGSKGYDKRAAEMYEKAWVIAKDALGCTSPVRLGLALNYSVCYYEILKDQKKACELAKQAFDDAISKLDQLDEASYKDSTLIMQLLRDNLTLWTAEEQGDGDD